MFYFFKYAKKSAGNNKFAGKFIGKLNKIKNIEILFNWWALPTDFLTENL